MNIEDVLLAVQNFRSTLELWGITNQVLLLAAGVASIIFAISLREVMCWYFRIYRLRDDIRSLQTQMEQLQTTLNETRSILLSSHEAYAPKELLKPEDLLKSALKLNKSEIEKKEPTTLKKNGRAKFRFDH